MFCKEKKAAPAAPIGGSSASIRLTEASRKRTDRSRSRDSPRATVEPARRGSGSESASVRRITAGRLNEIVREGVSNALRDMQGPENISNNASLVGAASSSADVSWTVAIAALVKVEAASRTSARIARQAAEAFEDQAHVISQQVVVLQRLGYMRRSD